MSDVETIRAEIKKLSAKAMQAKMDLHDLSEELPQGLETGPGHIAAAGGRFLRRARREKDRAQGGRGGRMTDWQTRGGRAGYPTISLPSIRTSASAAAAVSRSAVAT